MVEPEDIRRSWNPYLAGALTGGLIILSVWISGKYFGASTSFVRTAGMMSMQVVPEHTQQLRYYQEEEPKIDWQWMFVLGIAVGAGLTSIVSGTFRWKALPDMWVSRFGASIPKRAAVAFAGGVLMLFGARMAHGCTSGQGLSGVLQLSVSGVLTAFSFFITGIVMAHILYRGGEPR